MLFLLYRYAEGRGTAALFAWISDIDFLSSTELICTDKYNHCLRLANFTLSPPETSAFAGSCTVEGNTGGHRITSALFTYPELTEVNSDNSIMFMLDSYHTLLMIDLRTDTVTTLVTFDSLSVDMMLLGDSLLYLSKDTKLAVFNLETKEESVVAGDAVSGDAFGSFEQTRFDSVFGLLPWRTNEVKTLLLVADDHADRFVSFSYHVKIYMFSCQF